METTERRKPGRPRSERIKVRIPFRAYPEQLPLLLSVIKGTRDPGLEALGSDNARLRLEVEKLKKMNYDLAFKG